LKPCVSFIYPAASSPPSAPPPERAGAARYFPDRQYDRLPGAERPIPEEQWVDKRVVWDPRVNLLTSQGPGTAIDFGLKIIDLLVGREKAYEVASSLVMPAGIYNYYEE
jgi:4-methyl-5(b-hydroxyethyl)-thiazole monophosphate biosynthesis